MNSSTTVQQWDKEANQHSVGITLQGGQQYYIEAYQKENTGSDHLEVGWSSSTLSRQVIQAPNLTPTTAACPGWCPNFTVAGHGVQFDTWTGRNGSLLTNIPQGVLPNTLEHPRDVRRPGQPRQLAGYPPAGHPHRSGDG